jgi:hypothetical protein
MAASDNRAAAEVVKSPRRAVDAGGMSTTNTKNELIAVIDECRAGGMGVKDIRKQKFDPNNFYMTRTDGKQLGPIKVAGNADELNAKFGEAISYVRAMNKGPKRQAAAPRRRVAAE